MPTMGNGSGGNGAERRTACADFACREAGEGFRDMSVNGRVALSPHYAARRRAWRGLVAGSAFGNRRSLQHMATAPRAARMNPEGAVGTDRRH